MGLETHKMSAMLTTAAMSITSGEAHQEQSLKGLFEVYFMHRYDYHLSVLRGETYWLSAENGA